MVLSRSPAATLFQEATANHAVTDAFGSVAGDIANAGFAADALTAEAGSVSKAGRGPDVRAAAEAGLGTDARPGPDNDAVLQAATGVSTVAAAGAHGGLAFPLQAAFKAALTLATARTVLDASLNHDIRSSLEASACSRLR